MIPTHMPTGLVKIVIEKLKKEFPQIPVVTVDERFTSTMASRAMIDMGLSKKRRRDKSLVDKIAATIMLQEYLEKTKEGPH